MLREQARRVQHEALDQGQALVAVASQDLRRLLKQGLEQCLRANDAFPGRRHQYPASAGGVRLPDRETGLLESIDEGGRRAGRKVDGPGEVSDCHWPLPFENIRRQEIRRMDAHRLRHSHVQQTVCSAERTLRRQHLELQRQSIHGLHYDVDRIYLQSNISTIKWSRFLNLTSAVAIAALFCAGILAGEELVIRFG